MILTRHFTLEELTRSDYAVRKGIDNSPDADVFANLQMLANGLAWLWFILAVPFYQWRK